MITRRVDVTERGGLIAPKILVDNEDYDAVMAYRWYVDRDGYATRKVIAEGRNRTIYLHRELMGLAIGDGLLVDHINMDKLDNRRANLRVCTFAQNRQNLAPQARPMASRFRGVKRAGRDRSRWIATATVNGTRHKTRSFATELEAARAVHELRKRIMPFSEPDPNWVAYEAEQGMADAA